MAWSLRISWENGQPRVSFSHFMWRKPKTRQTNICSFFHKKHLREKTTNLREKTTALSLLRLYQLLFTCLLWKTTRHPLLVQFYTEQSKVQGIWVRNVPTCITKRNAMFLHRLRCSYKISAILLKRGRSYLVAPSLNTSCFPCRGPRVSTISF